MVTVYCPTCKRAHSAPESLVGKWVQCKHCGAKFAIKSGAPDPLQPPPAEKMEQLSQAVAEPTAPEPTGPEGLQVPPSAAGAKRPFGLVFVVFYWVISGALCLVGGYVLAVMGGALGGALGGARDMFGSSGLRDLGRAGALVGALLEFVGLLVFYLGLLTLVACYGLWTFRRWGLSLARGLAVAFVAIYVVALIIGIVIGAQIVTAVVGGGVSVLIMFYLYGSTGLRDRLQRYTRGGRQLQGVEQQMFE
ncbi:MAG TPA: hypothetical protein VNA25_19620 [Phycisphaerae bacterium]|nr:hypothetical protein [Phycisphaerae bacterium]